MWDKAGDLRPELKSKHREWLRETIVAALDKHGYDGMDDWLRLCLTGSLTTYQYSDASDIDVSLFVDTKKFPEWSRAEMIGIMISEFDSVKMPGTSHELQAFVVSPRLKPEDLYRPGLRSGYDIDANEWIVPPDKTRSHDVEHELNGWYVYGLETADKMEALLRYEPQKAIQFWHQLHKRRMRDQTAGKGDYSQVNIAFKMLQERGLFPKISEVSGEYIA